jgi:hypothetical protein
VLFPKRIWKVVALVMVKRNLHAAPTNQEIRGAKAEGDDSDDVGGEREDGHLAWSLTNRT